MKILLVSEDKALKGSLKSLEKSYYADVIQYQDAHKAMDNMDEIDPQVVIFNALDFPRHWKVAVKMLRAQKNYRQAIFVLLIADNFRHEDAMKASWLGVNGLISLLELESGMTDSLVDLIQRYLDLHPASKDVKQEGELLFLSPENMRLCTGDIHFLSENLARFIPKDEAAVSSLKNGDRLRNCSLKINNEICSKNFIIHRNKGALLLEEEGLIQAQN